MHIDIISDAICPWCYIGKKRLDKALDIAIDDLGPVTVNWRPFFLDPTIPAEGVDRKDYLKRKFGDNKGGSMYQALQDAGKEEGIPFAFSDIEKTPNTTDAHRLIRWAANGGQGQQHMLVEELFKNYFEQGKDIGKHSTLVEAAKKVGMDHDLVDELLQEDADVERIQEEDNLAREMGVQGVPCFVINNKYMIMGAQDPDVLANVLRRVNGKEQKLAEDQPD